MAEQNDDMPTIVEVLHVDVTEDETLVGVVARLQNGTAIRMPISLQAAIRLSGLLDQVREKHGWQLPDVPIQSDKIQ